MTMKKSIVARLEGTLPESEMEKRIANTIRTEHRVGERLHRGLEISIGEVRLPD